MKKTIVISTDEDRVEVQFQFVIDGSLRKVVIYIRNDGEEDVIDEGSEEIEAEIVVGKGVRVKHIYEGVDALGRETKLKQVYVSEKSIYLEGWHSKWFDFLKRGEKMKEMIKDLIKEIKGYWNIHYFNDGDKFFYEMLEFIERLLDKVELELVE